MCPLNSCGGGREGGRKEGREGVRGSKRERESEIKHDLRYFIFSFFPVNTARERERKDDLQNMARQKSKQGFSGSP
jgi:hypothetical protein